MPKIKAGHVCFIVGADRTRVVATAGDPIETLVWHQRYSPVDLTMAGSIATDRADALASKIRETLHDKATRSKWFTGGGTRIFELAAPIAEEFARPPTKRMSPDEVRALIAANPGVDPAELGIRVRGRAA
jgi:hypothetical protein